VIFEPRKKHLFHDISSTNFDTLVPSLYQRVETQKSFEMSEPLPDRRFKTSSSSAKRVTLSCEPLSATNTSHRKQETFIYEYPLHLARLPTKKRITERCSSVVQHGRHFDP
jgi:hypothetical protein